MNLSEDQTIEKYGKHGGHCNRNTLLRYEYEWTSISCGLNLIKRKHKLSKIKRKKNKFCQSIERCRTQNFLYMCRCIKTLRK